MKKIPVIKKAEKIAKKELRECYDAHGILAGRHHFTDYWARDGFFACLGALAIGDKNIVKKMVNLFFSYQRNDGLIPYRIMNGPVTIGKYLGNPKKYKIPKATYKLRGLLQEIYDGTTLAIIVLSELRLKDKRLIEKAEKALDYLEKKEKHGLLWDGVMAEWNDTAYKYGNLLYSNILYWYAVKKFNDYMKSINKKEKLRLQKEKDISKALRKRLWNGKYFADWHDYKRQDYFYAFGNLLAIAWGLTTKDESLSILKQAEKAKIGFTLETNTPAYPFWRIDIFHHLIGQGNYQNKSILWWQPATTYVAALIKLKLKKQADLQLKLMSKHALHYNGFYECYHRDGSPMNKVIFKSEHPFAGSSGMFLWAAHLWGYQ